MGTDTGNALWSTQLSAGLIRMNLVLDSKQQQTLLDYLALLEKWNKAYNLTAVRNPTEMVSRQLLDSLSILPWLSGGDILDVGTGPGLPGVPLAIALPGVHFTLLDSNGKKCRFVEQVKMELQLCNLSVQRCRVEAFEPDSGFDMVLSRAFASLPEILDLSAHLVADNGCVLAMKGVLHQAEIDAAVARCASVKIHALKVPGSSAQRHAIVCRYGV